MAKWAYALDLGVVHYMSYLDTIAGSGPIIESLEECLSDADFSIIDVTHVADPGARKRSGEILRNAGIRVVFSGIPPLVFNGYNLSSCDTPAREAAVARGMELIDEALSIGAETIFFISGPDPGPEKRRLAYEMLAKSMGSLCSYASTRSSSRELVVALEPADRTVQHKQLLGPFLEVGEFAHEIRRDYSNFGLVVDQSHIQQLDEQPEKVFARCGEFTRHVHLANAVVDEPAHPLYGDQHPPFGIPGSRVGVEELSGFIKTILENTFWDGRIKPGMSLEVKPRLGEKPRAVIERAKADFVKAWTMYQTQLPKSERFQEE
jgi:sugar phosphate isomerase/epimerase